MSHFRILVTGGAGFIGSHVVDRLVAGGDEVVVVDDLSTGRAENIAAHLSNHSAEFHRADFADKAVLSKLLPGTDVVVHLAGLVSVDRSVVDPATTMRVNVQGTDVLLERCVEQGVERLVFASSAAVYGDLRPPLREDLPSRPLSPYAASKVAGEAHCRSYWNAYGLQTVVLRLMNVYGPRSRGGPYGGVMTKFAEALNSGGPLTVQGDGKQTRDFVHVSDVASAVSVSVKASVAPGETFNVGSGVPTSVNSLAKHFMSSSSRRVPVVHGPPRQAEIRASYADISKAKRMLGFTPRVPLAHGIKQYLDWFENDHVIHES